MAKPNVREKIVDAGLKALHEHGYHATGVQDITNAAGVPKGSFYNHFDSKEALGAEIVDRYGFGGTGSEELADKSVPALDRIRRYFDTRSQMCAARNFVNGCLIGNMTAELSDSSPMISERLSAVYASWTRDLAGAISDAQADGSMSAALSAEELAIFLLDAWEGAMLRSRVEKHPRSLDVFLRVGLTQILR
jgi:TetR/AcrR family transcriptional repressor of nem operon